jgi:hypothetical protein
MTDESKFPPEVLEQFLREQEESEAPFYCRACAVF